MSTIQFSGLATGLDTGSIVDQLVAIRRLPITRLENRKSLYEKQIAALKDLQAKLDALADAAAALDTSREFGAFAGTSSREDLLTVTADSLAAPGTYEITVGSLASHQKDMTQGYASLGDDVGSGTFTLTVGGEAHQLELAAGASSLSDLRDAINEAGVGVYASILNDGSDGTPYRLILTSADTGTDAAFTADFGGLGGGLAPTLTNVSAAADASLTIDSIPVTSAGNSVGSAISGLTFDLLGVEEGATITVRVDTDTTAIADRVQAFVDAYNDVFTYLNDQSLPDATLRGHPALRSVASRLQTLAVLPGGGDGAYSMLAQVGISQGAQRQLEFDRARFEAALGDGFADVRNLFVEGEGAAGKAYLIGAAIDDLTDPAEGLFKINTRALNQRIDDLERTIDRYERSLDTYRATLERKFTAMETLVSSLQAQGNYLVTQMNALMAG